jgi:hypothetical protein
MSRDWRVSLFGPIRVLFMQTSSKPQSMIDLLRAELIWNQILIFPKSMMI